MQATTGPAHRAESRGPARPLPQATRVGQAGKGKLTDLPVEGEGDEN